MNVKDVMVTTVITTTPQTHIKDVAALLAHHAISAVPVIDEHDRLVGILSEFDLIGLQTSPDPRHQITPSAATDHGARVAADVMTRNPIVLPEDADIATAACLMLERGIKSIPVVSGERIVGIVARRDLIAVLARADTDVKGELDRALAEEAGLIGELRAEVSGGVVSFHGDMDEQTRRLAEIVARRVPGVVAVTFPGGD